MQEVLETEIDEALGAGKREERWEMADGNISTIHSNYSY
jgi:hypothetical protein